ncbi:hypothetical protein CBR_g26023 [Chara braunii]|uniref:Uncharacterized protein n=1 Tax=Chara braunii TaxID=69332 RepID=A0A388L706_CHABU|nr:hypothetical protein CBR_g26023 [Chara braunii]|eukprot:GBG78085.1 hypothetical protein CBR_g26023 [Chara braunii]
MTGRWGIWQGEGDMERRRRMWTRRTTRIARMTRRRSRDGGGEEMDGGKRGRAGGGGDMDGEEGEDTRKGRRRGGMEDEEVRGGGDKEDEEGQEEDDEHEEEEEEEEEETERRREEETWRMRKGRRSKEKEELRRRLAQLGKLKEDRELARAKKKVMEQEIEWETEQTHMETEQTRMEMEQTRMEMDHEEDRFAPSSSARPPRRQRETPSTPSRPPRRQKLVRQPNLGIRIEEPSTTRTLRTRSQAKKNPVVDYETLLAGWKEITTDGSKMNVVDYCMSMKSFLRTRTMAELQCLRDEEQIDYATREKTIRGLIANRMQQAILRTSNSRDNDEDEVTPERDPDIMDT